MHNKKQNYLNLLLDRKDYLYLDLSIYNLIFLEIYKLIEVKQAILLSRVSSMIRKKCRFLKLIPVLIDLSYRFIQMKKHCKKD
jgi:hypothetical protein